MQVSADERDAAEAECTVGIKITEIGAHAKTAATARRVRFRTGNLPSGGSRRKLTDRSFEFSDSFIDQRLPLGVRDDRGVDFV